MFHKNGFFNVDYVCGRLQATSSASQLIEMRHLRAYTTYEVYVEACTRAGCTQSPSTSLTTSTDLPVNLSAPVVVNVTSTSVYLTWTDPLVPNGRILRYCLSSVINYHQLYCCA